MSTRYFGQPIKRNEDPRLLTGQALFTDDVHMPGLLHVTFVRSDYAHGYIRSIDTSAARAVPGVIAIYTADDLGDYWQPGPLLVPPPPIPDLVFNPRMQVPLAKGKVRHVGEPLVAIVAESRYIAEDAAEQVVVMIDPLPAIVDIERALAPDAALVHDDLPQNLNAHAIQRKGDYAIAQQQADLIIKRRFHYDRGTAAAMENRGIVASWDAKAEQLTMYDTTQAPIAIRNGIAAMLGLSEKQVRVIAPFIGGGFGPKIMMFYPEEVVLAWITVQLGQPVKWIEDRQENFYATTQERGQVHDAEMALTKEGRVLGIKDVFIHDAGAYAPYGLTVALNSQCTLLGQYDVPHYYSEFQSVFTNKPIVTPYRGAVVAGNAIHAASVKVREKVLKKASEELEVAEADLELVDGTVRVKGSPESAIKLGALAARANPMRGAVKPGSEPGLEATDYFGPERGATASGVHAMIVEVDLETLMIAIKKYVVVHDCGRVINPMILEGQIQGGVAQGIGNAFYEQLHFDEHGQLLNASFMDYLVPTADTVPTIETDHVETPSPLNPLGVKGAGEAGAIPVGPLFAQAIEDALQGLGIEILEIPLSPSRLFSLVHER